MKGKTNLTDKINTCPICKGYTIIDENDPSLRECRRCLNDRNKGYTFQIKDSTKDFIEIESEKIKFDIGSTKIALDPDKIAKGKICFLKVTLTGIEEKDDMSFYTWTCGKKKGMFEVDFSHRMLCDTKEEMIEKSFDLTQKAIESLQKGISVCADSIKKIKEQNKTFEKQIVEQRKLLIQLQEEKGKINS